MSNFVFTSFDDPNADIQDFSGVGTYAQGVNDAGQIVGYYFDSNEYAHGFLHQNSSFTDIVDPLSSGTTRALGISGTGEVVGWYVGSFQNNPAPAYYAFMETNNNFSSFANPNNPGDFIEPQAVNKAGILVGDYPKPPIQVQWATGSFVRTE